MTCGARLRLGQFVEQDFAMRIEMGDEKFPMAIRQENEADAEGQHHQQRIAEQQLDPVERTGLEAETEVGQRVAPTTSR